MRLLHAIRTVDPVSGGPLSALTQLVPMLYELGLDVDIVSLDDPSNRFVSDSGLPVVALGPAIGNYGVSRRFWSWIHQNIEHYDAVVIHGLWQFHGFSVRAAAAKAGRPYFVFPHGMLDPWFKRAYPRKHFKKRLYWPLAEYRIIRDAAAVLFTTEQERILARSTFTPYDCVETVVNYGTAEPDGNPDAQKDSFRKKYPSINGRPYWLFMGRLHPKKGVDLLLEAYAKIGDERILVIAGPSEDATYVESLRKRAWRLGISHKVLWTGMLSGDEKWGAVRGADAFVLPSHQENFGVAVAEALAVGTPVLISREVNIWREIEADQVGITGPDTIVGTTEMLKQWTRLSDSERSAMRVRAREVFSRRFHIRATALSLFDTIKKYGQNDV